MTDYEREWFSERGLPGLARLHMAHTNRQGRPVRFLVQLEYWHAGEWLVVARFDHEQDGPAYRNVEETGLHLDIYLPDGTQIRKLDHWPPQPSNVAMGKAEAFLRANAQPYVRRFEKWL
jgi:hypothetical protein